MLALLPSATKLRQGNVFTPVCHSVHGGCLPQCMLGYTHPWADIPPGQTPYTPWQTPPWANKPLGRHPLLGRNPPGQTPPPPGQTQPHLDRHTHRGRHFQQTPPFQWSLQRTVRILLECILVTSCFVLHNNHFQGM